MATKTGTALAESSPAPKVPETSVLVFCWIGIVIAAGTSITFNIHHDTSWLPNLMAAIAGFAPPALAAVLAHVASAFKDLALKIAVFAVCGGAMAVSSIGTTKTLEHGYTFVGGLGFSLVADSASMLCLWGLIEIYSAQARLRQWHAGQDPGTTEVAQNQAAAGHRQAVPEPVPGTGAKSAEPSAGTTAAAAAGAPAAPAASAALARRPAAAKTAAVAAGEGSENRDAVLAEIADRPRPVVQDSLAQQQRALDILAEFKRRTGKRMNNGELGKALGISKTDACLVRQAVAGREAA
jgi:hypothetical protein